MSSLQTSQQQHYNNNSNEIKQLNSADSGDTNRAVRYQNLRQLVPVPNAPISIKCRCGSDARRVTVHTVPTYDELSFLIHRLFRPVLSNNLNNLIIKYIDEDFDLVSVTDDLDINHAIAVSSTFKVIVFDRETLPFPNSKAQDLSSLTGSLQRPFLGTSSLDLRLELAQLTAKVDLLLQKFGKDQPSSQTGYLSKKNSKILTSADVEEFVKSSNPQNFNNLAETPSAPNAGQNEGTAATGNEAKPASVYAPPSAQQQSTVYPAIPNQQLDSYPPPARPQAQVPAANAYQGHQTNPTNSIPQPQQTGSHPSANQNAGYPPASGSYQNHNVQQQPQASYSYPPNNSMTLSNQYPPPSSAQAYTQQRPTSVSSQGYPPSMYPPQRPSANTGTSYNSNQGGGYSYPSAYPSAPGTHYQQ